MQDKSECETAKINIYRMIRYDYYLLNLIVSTIIMSIILSGTLLFKTLIFYSKYEREIKIIPIEENNLFPLLAVIALTSISWFFLLYRIFSLYLRFKNRIKLRALIIPHNSSQNIIKYKYTYSDKEYKAFVRLMSFEPLKNYNLNPAFNLWGTTNEFIDIIVNKKNPKKSYIYEIICKI